ncbi:hypothetical protein BU23DRAFT_565250 [Bimuria novae-zelandiae CBS 107.79]|uniref:Uncharacterized protein n=1 Tax=Bimuria novae-zelandiae CBS 107.79 TaxID=1447943 RepID=A0A6A5VN03_9PLEO|nr:hypothetical protein BU23DRAFT_565250 [Bimuria novae-zelandiae CBS 107.79]
METRPRARSKEVQTADPTRRDGLRYLGSAEKSNMNAATWCEKPQPVSRQKSPLAVAQIILSIYMVRIAASHDHVSSPGGFPALRSPPPVIHPRPFPEYSAAASVEANQRILLTAVKQAVSSLSRGGCLCFMRIVESVDRHFWMMQTLEP